MMTRILTILITAVMSAAMTAGAQTSVGTWGQVPAFGGTPQKIVATPDRLYYVSAGALGSVETKGGDVRTYSTDNLLSDSKVKDIYYNNDRDFLAIIYDNCNIDLLHGDDRCYNMADILEAQFNVEKVVHHVSFHGDRMYVSTNFGLVEFDTRRHCVVWSMILDGNVESATVVGGKLLINYAGGLWISPVEERHNTLSRFTYLGNCAMHSPVTISDTELYYLDGAMTAPWQMNRMTLMDDYTRFDLTYYGPHQMLSLAHGKDGGAVGVAPDRLYYVTSAGSVSEVMLPSALDGCASGRMEGGLVASYGGRGDVWTVTSKGVCRYGIADDSTPTLLTGPVRPNGTSSIAIGYISKGAASGNIYVGSMGPSNIYGFYESQPSHVDMKSDFGTWSEVTPVPDYWSGRYYPSYDGTCYGNFCIVENPDSPSLLYIGNFWEGIYRHDLSGRLPLMSLNWLNSPLTHVVDWSCIVPAMAFDPAGNLWVTQSVENSGGAPLMMLPASKTAAATVSADDWKAVPIEQFIGNKDGRMLICRRSNTILLTSQLASQVVGIDTRGTWDKTGDDRITVRTTLTDQDGLQFTSLPFALAEDLNGRVWVGHETGVYEIQDPSKFHNEDFRVNRLKVPRNDGTNNADYLLNGQRVTSIAVDGSNRKWIGTDASGLYLVTADGSAVIENFTAENSPLTTNCIYSVYCDDSSNLVYVGTSAGLMVYSSDSSPAAADYSDVYAYPNPVRPEYTGWITVTGLMDNSLVKIADAAGHVFFNGRSNGGMITWDGTGPDGSRVRTGVYYVYASEQPGGEGSGAVTKILVVN